MTSATTIPSLASSQPRIATSKPIHSHMPKPSARMPSGVMKRYSLRAISSRRSRSGPGAGTRARLTKMRGK